MKLKPEQLSKLALLIFDAVSKKKMIRILTSQESVIRKIESILMTDARKEADIETEARKMMEKFEHQIQSGEIDYHKMFSMIKKQIMKNKKFIP